MKLYKCIVALALFLLVFTVSKSIYAQQFIEKEVDPSHVWTITFNEPVDVTSFQQHVTLMNQQSESLAYEIHVRDAYTVEMVPTAGSYAAGELYTITMPTALTSMTGNALIQETVLTFITKEEPLPSDVLTESEQQLAALINAYRVSIGAKSLPISKSLTIVARTHVADSNAHSPEKAVDGRGEKCNLHSWSTNGPWTPVCYTKDHMYKQALWSKPRELTQYIGSGYEISLMVSRGLTPQLAVALWKESAKHEELMASRGVWEMLTTMGVAIEGKYAHVWFGSDRDPAGYYE